MLYKEAWSYCKKCDPNVNGSGITQMTRDNDFGYCQEEENRLVFCFAGSNDFKDWLENFQFFKLDEGDTIHKGFYDAWASFKDKVRSLTEDFKKRKPNGLICCFGHSRGAALAILCSRHIAKNVGFPCKMMVFGAPMLGDETYANQFNLLPIDASCLQNGWDLVCYVPPADLGFYRVGRQDTIGQPFWHHLIWFRISDHLGYEKEVAKRNI